MKVIDLLNKIANGEEVPKKVMSRGVDWELGEGTNQYYYLDDCGNNRFKKDDLFEELYEMHGLRFLNDEVEIIEEGKGIPEKLEYQVGFGGTEQEVISEYVDDVVTKVNEIIDYLKNKGDE